MINKKLLGYWDTGFQILALYISYIWLLNVSWYWENKLWVGFVICHLYHHVYSSRKSHLVNPLFIRHFYFFLFKIKKRRRMRSVDRPVNFEVKLFHLFPNSAWRRNRHASSSAVHGPKRRLGSKKLFHLSRHCMLFRVKPMAFEALSHARSFLWSSLDSTCRNLSSSSVVHVPFFISLTSGRKW